MYVCQCDGKAQVYGNEAFHETEVDKEGICQRCGYYALWTESNHFKINYNRVSFLVTVFLSNGTSFITTDLERLHKKVPHHINTDTLISKIRNGKYYHNINRTILVLKGEHDELPSNYSSLIKKEVHCYTEDGFKETYEDAKAAAKELGISVSVVRNNLARHTTITKDGYIFTYSKKFNLENYLNTLVVDVDFKKKGTDRGEFLHWNIHEEVDSLDDLSLDIDQKYDEESWDNVVVDDYVY